MLVSLLLGGPEIILLETIDSFVVNSNFCEPPCREVNGWVDLITPDNY